MTIEDQKLVEQCEAGIKTLAGVDEWVRANPQAAGSSGEALLRESNRLARALRKEAATAARKMCVGVFGPSQSGKSYLISALAQDADGSLLAALGDESADFIQDINPAGGKESTGLVTRFTLTPPPHPARRGRPRRPRGRTGEKGQRRTVAGLLQRRRHDRPEGIRHPEFPGHRRGPEA